MGVVEGVHECIRQIVYLAHLLMHSLVVIAIGASTLSPTFDFESDERIIIIYLFSPVNNLNNLYMQTLLV